MFSDIKVIELQKRFDYNDGYVANNAVYSI